MQKQLEQYFGGKVKIAEYKNKLPLPIFMTMREITMVEIYGAFGYIGHNECVHTYRMR